MPANILNYNGYFAEFGYDDSADAFHGRVLGINDVVDFYGRTVDELKTEFRTSVDEYIAWCHGNGVNDSACLPLDRHPREGGDPCGRQHRPRRKRRRCATMDSRLRGKDG
jgi:hypothetical protein